jgi:beta-fructofuranosidase
MINFYNSPGFNFNDFDLLVKDDVIYAAYVKKIPFPLADKDAKQPNRFGMAKSVDGINWQEVDDILLPVPNTWEESLWAGCFTKQDGKYVIYYTGVKILERQPSCKIGKAYSTDLIHFEKDKNNPLLTFDSNNPYYSDEPNLSFRDPFYFEYGGKKYLLFCGKDRLQSEGKRGCVGILEETESNKFKWLPPLFSPGIYKDGLECPAIYNLKNKWYLLYGIDHESGEKAFRYAVADSPFGPYKTFTDNQLLSSNNYVCRIIKFKRRYFLYNWYRDLDNGLVRERLAPPKEVHILDDDRLSVSDLNIT